MASVRDWSTGYLEQARTELAELEVLLQRRPSSVAAMLLQMIFEKLAKAALIRKGALRVEDAFRSHKAAFAFIRLLVRRDLSVGAEICTRRGPATGSQKGSMPAIREARQSRTRPREF